MWSPSSPRVLAVEAVAGEFLGWRLLLSGLVMTGVALWVGMNVSVTINERGAALGIIMATSGAVSTVAWTWVRSGRWQNLMRFPLSMADLTRAVQVLGMFLVLIEALLPATVFIVTSAAGSLIDAGILLALGLGLAPVLLIVWSGAARRHRLSAAAVLAGLVIVVIYLGPGYAAAIASVAGAICVAAAIDLSGDSSRPTRVPRLAGSSLVVGEILTSRMTAINSVGMLGIGIAFNLMLQAQGMPFMLGFIVVLQNTPLNSYFSRHPSTLLVITTAPRAWLTLLRFGSHLAVFYVLCAVLVTLAPMQAVPHPRATLVVIVIASIVASAAAMILERYRPLTSWKSEREVLRHPRKYVPSLAAFAVVLAAWPIVL